MKKILTLLLIVVWTPLSFAAGNADAGKTKVATCTACHGADGNSANGLWPKLAGQHASYLVTQMQAFKKGKADGGRYDPSMTPLMAALSTQDMEDIAAYYSQQTLKWGKADPTLVKRGEDIYRSGDFSKHITACIACHGPSGDGNEQAGFPHIAGQHPEYTLKQLQDFKSGARHNDMNHIMRDIAKRMDEEDMKAVASYMAGLH